jgi:hypothetical protein
MGIGLKQALFLVPYKSACYFSVVGDSKLWRLTSQNDLQGVKFHGVLDSVDNNFGMFLQDLWNPLALQIRLRELAESFAQSVLKLG